MTQSSTAAIVSPSSSDLRKFRDYLIKVFTREIEAAPSDSPSSRHVLALRFEQI
jgi:hypothetical protein